jgi:hypothetical protein
MGMPVQQIQQEFIPQQAFIQPHQQMQQPQAVDNTAEIASLAKQIKALEIEIDSNFSLSR